MLGVGMAIVGVPFALLAALCFWLTAGAADEERDGSPAGAGQSRETMATGRV